MGSKLIVDLGSKIIKKVDSIGGDERLVKRSRLKDGLLGVDWLGVGVFAHEILIEF